MFEGLVRCISWLKVLGVFERTLVTFSAFIVDGLYVSATLYLEDTYLPASIYTHLHTQTYLHIFMHR